jgi:hypothetical protein
LVSLSDKESIQERERNSRALCRYAVGVVFTLREWADGLLAGNPQETICHVHGSFALLFSLLFSGRASNAERSYTGE